MFTKMTELAEWQQTNETYLSQAMHWLRLRLSWLSSGQTQEAAVEAEIEAAAGRMAYAAGANPPPAFVHLGLRFGLHPFEEALLLLCLAAELDTRIPGLCARAQDSNDRPFPTFALGLALFDNPAWEALSPERPLRYWQLVNIGGSSSEPLIQRPLYCDARIVNYVKGLNHLDENLLPYVLPVKGEDRGALLPAAHVAACEQIARLMEAQPERPPVVQLCGPDDGGKVLLAREAARKLGLYLYHLPAAGLPTTTGDLDRFLRLWQREAALLPLALYLEVGEAEETAGFTNANSPLARFLARYQDAALVGSREALPGLGDTSVTVEVQKPTPGEQRTAWQKVLGEEHPLIPRLASQFDLNLPAIEQAARLAQASGDDLWRLCLARTRPRLDALAQRIEPKATWEDIVLTSEAEGLLRQLANQVDQRQRVYDEWGFRERMSRGLGITGLFSGESGTGKTMAAEVLANELQLNLYRIDLSAVVSKYIGETEKNLRRLFDAAEDGGAILFFDEADALFGKRSEVKDSHDRYANIEINYLLQRMEAYRGLAILATNKKSALDPAFLRRLRFVIEFPFPTPHERREIWKRVFPSATPTQGLDIDHLSRLTLTGSSIYNVALNAAFLAAQAGSPVNMPLVLEAARTEFRKIGRTFSEADLRWQPNGAHA
jgi:hypothetical protein